MKPVPMNLVNDDNRAASRRRALLLTGLLLVSHAGVSTARAEPGSASAEPAPAAVRFVAPQGPMLLTGVLRRALPDGSEIVIGRTWRIRFTRDDTGYRVDGEQTDSMVTVPPRLAVLGELERNRPETGLFPGYLDPDGRISDGGPNHDAALRAQLFATVRGMVKSARLQRDQREDVYRFALETLQSDTTGRLPDDLFAPRTGPHTETSHFDLPGGLSGSITKAENATADPATGLMIRFERTVVTEAGGNSRLTRELWTLSPAPP